MKGFLKIESGPHVGRTIELQRGQKLTVGRTSKSDYVVSEDNYMSGGHMQVEFDGAGCVVRDLGSSNGTFVNGARTSEGTAHPGDRITAGQTTMLFEVEADAAGPQPARTAISIQVPAFAGAAERTQTGPFSFPQPEPPRPPSTDKAPAYAEPPAPPSPAEPLTPVQSKLADLLEAIPDSLYALASPATTAKAEPLDSRPQSQKLVTISQDRPSIEKFIRETWSREECVLVTSPDAAGVVREHLARFTILHSTAGDELPFPLHDARVLRLILPGLTAEQARGFFGPISAFLAASEQPDELMTYVPFQRGVYQKAIPLA